MKAFLLASIAGLGVLAASPSHAGNVPPNNVPSLSDWEQLLVQNLTGPNGVPVALGAPPAASGACAVNTQVGGQMAGSFKATSACSATSIILTFLNSAPNGFECGAKDLTTPADTLAPASYTTLSFTFTATLAANDQVVWSCRAF